MQQVSQQETRYRWIGVAVAGIALLGWLFGLYFWSVASDAQDRLAAQTALEGTAQELTGQIATLRDEAEEATLMRDENTVALDAVSAELEQARRAFAALEDDATTVRTARDTMQTELDEGRAELAQIEDGLTETQNRITESTQELSAIGERLEGARQQEADLQAVIAQLSAEASQLSEEAAGAEERVQAARDAEASLEERLQTAQAEQAAIAETRDSLQQSVDTLTQRQETLASDTLAAEEQLQALQAMTGELTTLLADRSAQLQTIENRIGGLLEEAGTVIRADASGLATGTPYMFENVALLFQPDGMFDMTNDRTDKTVTGGYALADGVITFSDAEGDTGAADFPMVCGITISEAELTLTDTDGSCALLDGATFAKGDS